MAMKPGLRKFALTAHITSSVGWFGGVVGFLVLVVAALTTGDVETVQAAWVGMEFIGWFAIVPLAILSLLTGLVMSLGTKWGLVRHYWVLFKLLLTIFATTILLLNMQTVSSQANLAREMGSVNFGSLWSELLHAGVGMLVLLVIIILSVYKPRGMTPFGQRKQYK